MKHDMTPTRLADYRAPDFAIDRVDLDFRLDPKATRVIARLSLRRTGPGAGSLVLEGGELRLIALSVNGRGAAASDYVVAPDRLELKRVPDRPFTVEIETEIDPSSNTQLMGLFRSGAS